MSVKKFKFVSPGVFLNEIDNSQLPKVADAVGPIVIGRLRRGPALKPVRCESYSEFIEIFVFIDGDFSTHLQAMGLYIIEGPQQSILTR